MAGHADIGAGKGCPRIVEATAERANGLADSATMATVTIYLALARVPRLPFGGSLPSFFLSSPSLLCNLERARAKRFIAAACMHALFFFGTHVLPGPAFHLPHLLSPWVK